MNNLKSIEEFFGHLRKDVDLTFSISDDSNCLHTSVVMEGNKYAITFESDHLSKKYYLILRKKIAGVIPNALMDSHMVNLRYVGKILNWEKYPQDSASLSNWLLGNLENSPERLFNMSGDLFTKAIDMQYEDM